MSDHALYRFYGTDGELLYVGITMNPAARWESHRKQKPWWAEVVGMTVERCVDREAALLAEREAIIRERPAYNVVHSAIPNHHHRDDRTVTCAYCSRRMIRYWDDEPHPGEKNQCMTCNAIMCDAFDTGWSSALQRMRGA